MISKLTFQLQSFFINVGKSRELISSAIPEESFKTRKKSTDV